MADSLEEAKLSIFERQFLVGCSHTDFEIIELLGVGCNGMALKVRCIQKGHPLPEKFYTLKVLFNLGIQTSNLFDRKPYQGTVTHSNPFQNEYRNTLSTLPPHPNIITLFAVYMGRLTDEMFKLIPLGIKEFITNISNIFIIF